MTILYIDTSSSFLYSGIVKEDKLLISVKEKFEKDMSAYALVRIQHMFETTNLQPKDIDKIIVVNGPGSFTGIRIGVTIAKTFAWSLKKEIATITSLDAMAVSLNSNIYKIPLIDARRGFVYAAIYDKDNQIIMENKYISMNTLKVAAESLNSDYVWITNDNIEGKKESYQPNILEIVKRYQNKESINPHSVNPIYLKRTEAEETKGIEC